MLVQAARPNAKIVKKKSAAFTVTETGRFPEIRPAKRAVDRPAAFWLAVAVIAGWLVTGPIFHFADTWQLVINTVTTIITFLMVFLIQSTQNRDNEALQLKLDELLRANEGAHSALLDIEELSEEELDQIKKCYATLARRALEEVRAGKSDLGAPDIKRKTQAQKN